MKKLKVTVDGQVYEVEVEALDAPASEDLGSGAVVKPTGGSGKKVPSPLAGKVVELKVAEGEAVEAGDTILVLEAMKMNTLVSASESGTIGSILVAAGDMVEEGQGLVTIS